MLDRLAETTGSKALIERLLTVCTINTRQTMGSISRLCDHIGQAKCQIALDDWTMTNDTILIKVPARNQLSRDVSPVSEKHTN